MKLIVDLKIRCEAPADKHVCATVGKEIETDLVPMVGMELEDSVWGKPRPIERVTINPAEGSYYLHVGDDSAENRDRCQQLKQLYHTNGWTRLGLKVGQRKIGWWSRKLSAGLNKTICMLKR